MFSDPVKNLKAFGLKESDVVADLGAGTGYYAVAAGQMVTQGKVYAVEVVKDYLTTIQNKVKDAGLTNVECLWGNIEKPGGTKIADGVVDKVIVSNVLFQVEHKERFVAEAKRILKKGGKLLLVDWTKLYKNAMPKEQAQKLFESAGFTLEREINAGQEHYGMILVKQ